MMTFTHARLLFACGLAFLTGAATAENWPQFRGPRGDGTSSEKNVPVRWSTDQNVAWKTPIPGEGHSSPVVWDRSVFLTSALKDSGDRVLIRLDAESGKILWQRNIANAPKESMHNENSAASSTPATDGTHVFTSFQVGDKVDFRCFNFEGDLVWSVQPLQFSGEHGYSYSPVLHKDLVLIDCRQESEAAVLGLDKRTGTIRWHAKPRNNRISHVTPLLVNDGQRTQLIVSGSDEMASYDPDSGEQLWRCDGLSDVAVAGMAFGDGMVFGTAGYPARTRMAVRTSGNGDVTESGVAWKLHKQVSYVPSPVFHNGHLYTIVDDGLMFCFNAKTGEAVWDHRIGGRFRSSLVLADENIYATNDKGLTTVLRATPDGFQQVAVNELNESCYGTAAISNGKIFLRTGANLYCIGGTGGESASALP